jgi:hypothetical protein
MYADNLKRIRQRLSDPSGSIWSNAFLLSLWNNAQRSFSRMFSFDVAVDVLRHPSEYHMTYAHEWEYEHAGADEGAVRRQTLVNWSSGIAYTYSFEGQHLGLSTTSVESGGNRVTQPWEWYYIPGGATELVPCKFPLDYRSAIYMAYDNEPVEYRAYKEIMSRDGYYKSYPGRAIWFTIRDELSDEFYLYPRPPMTLDETIDSGMETSTNFTTEADEIGVVVDSSSAETTGDYGVSIDHLRSTGNVVLIYRTRAIDIVADTDEPAFPQYLQKYLEYDVLKHAFEANTDGRNDTLAAFWQQRKDLGAQVLQKYRFARLADRDYRLTGGVVRSYRQQRHPKLPNNYNDRW